MFCIVLVQSQFENNTALVSAGAIHGGAGSNITIDLSDFNANSADSGGAIQASNACVTITHSNFGNHTVSGSGGAILLDTVLTETGAITTVIAAPCTSSIAHTQFAMNSAATGGAISSSAPLKLLEVRYIVQTANLNKVQYTFAAT
jgi:predicted outer membrane repeat protein